MVQPHPRVRRGGGAPACLWGTHCQQKPASKNRIPAFNYAFELSSLATNGKPLSPDPGSGGAVGGLAGRRGGRGPACEGVKGELRHYSRWTETSPCMEISFPFCTETSPAIHCTSPRARLVLGAQTPECRKGPRVQGGKLRPPRRDRAPASALGVKRLALPPL